VVDYERSNFSISQALFPENEKADIVSILPIDTYEKHSSPSRGVIIGAAVAAVAFACLIIRCWFGYRRYVKYKKKKEDKARNEANGKIVDDLERGELQDEVMGKVSGQSWRPEMDCGVVPEIEGRQLC
jgi:hypothetical protein